MHRPDFYERISSLDARNFANSVIKTRTSFILATKTKIVEELYRIMEV